MKASAVISARLPKERVKLIEEIAREESVDKSTILDRALEHYTREWKLKKQLSELGISPTKTMREALQREVEEKTRERLRRKVEEANLTLSKLNKETWTKAIRESRDKR